MRVTSSATIFSRSDAGTPCASSPNCRLSLTVIQGKIASSWKTYPRSGLGPATGAPSQSTTPLDGVGEAGPPRQRGAEPPPAGRAERQPLEHARRAHEDAPRQDPRLDEEDRLFEQRPIGRKELPVLEAMGAQLYQGW